MTKPKGPLCSENGILGFTNEEIEAEFRRRLEAEQKDIPPEIAKILGEGLLELE